MQFKLGEWYKSDNNYIVQVTEKIENFDGVKYKLTYNDNSVNFIDEGSNKFNLTHLPDCTGYDWVPKSGYVPYTFDTCPAIIKVVSRATKIKYVAHLICDKYVFVYGYLTFKEFFEQYTDINGGPLGTKYDT